MLVGQGLRGRSRYWGVLTPSDDVVLLADAPAAVSCDHCGHVLGVYEPLVMFHDGQARETSRAAEVRLPLSARYFHTDCYRTL